MGQVLHRVRPPPEKGLVRPGDKFDSEEEPESDEDEEAEDFEESEESEEPEERETEEKTPRNNDPLGKSATSSVVQDQRSASGQEHARRSPKAIVIFLAILAAGLAADLGTKHLAFSRLLADQRLQARLEGFATVMAVRGQSISSHEALSVFRQPGTAGIAITLSSNPGAVFGLRLPQLLMAVASVLIVAVVFYLFATSPARAYWVHVAMALVLAGALGNLYDRLFGNVQVLGYPPISHEVRDFIDASNWHYPWIFNVADAWLVLGVALLVVYWGWPRKPQKPADA